MTADKPIEVSLEYLTELGKSRSLLGLIERHGWIVGPKDGIGPEAGRGPWEVETGTCFHRGATLIEALTAAAGCPRCVGGSDAG